MAIMMGQHTFDDPSFQLFQTHTCDYVVGGDDLPQVSDICCGNLMTNIHLTLENRKKIQAVSHIQEKEPC
jgi:hypothetical protein